MNDSSEWKGADRGEAVLAVFQRGAEFAKELLDENIRLRQEIADIGSRHRQAAQSDDEWGKLREELTSKIEELEGRNQTILEELKAIESENRQFAERFRDIEEENNNLASLYVASYQLHSTLDVEEVVNTILEIVINLIGGEIFAVYLCDGSDSLLGAVASEGDLVTAFPDQIIGEDFVGRSVSEGVVAIDEHAAPERAPGEGGKPIVSIPLLADDQAVGAIAIYRFLQQKQGFSALDHELFTLLAGHAAAAIFAAKLYSRSERRLSTIREFIDVLAG